MEVLIVGTGFVADLYMRSFARHPEIRIAGAFDIDAERLAAFCAYWKAPAAPSLDALFAMRGAGPSLVLNLTNPAAHDAVNRAALERGFDVYSEKPLSLSFDNARALARLAEEKGLILASAPCSFLSEAAQTFIAALDAGRIGTPKLAYAELDDDYAPQAPYRTWKSESGAPWPFRDEFEVGATLEHAGYALSWLIAAFGPIRNVTAASALLVPEKLEAGAAPDFSVGVLFFRSGPVARLTTSLVAPVDRSLRVFGDKGVLSVKDVWRNAAPVVARRRFVLRRRLVTDPLGARVRLQGPSHPKVGRRGAAAMNFALGPAEILAARREKRRSRLAVDMALHMTEATLALHNALDRTGAVELSTTCERPAPASWARLRP